MNTYDDKSLPAFALNQIDIPTPDASRFFTTLLLVLIYVVMSNDDLEADLEADFEE